MAPISAIHTLLSPAELSYLHTSLASDPPVRPDGRSATEFRPLIAETDVVPSANGSARICFADGIEAVVGVKVEVERTSGVAHLHLGSEGAYTGGDGDDEGEYDNSDSKQGKGIMDKWVEVNIEIPGMRDDDPIPVFLSQMLREAALADGELVGRLRINSKWNWRLFIDVLLLSPALSYPLPLLSLTTYLALRTTRLPRLKSEGDEDPFFDDDWEAAEYLYRRSTSQGKHKDGEDMDMQDVTKAESTTSPPITLLVMSVGNNVLFDPTREELAVADAILAVSVSVATSTPVSSSQSQHNYSILSLRTLDLPGRLTNPGMPNSLNSATGGVAPQSEEESVLMRELITEKGVWRPPRGGASRSVLKRMISMIVQTGGVADEVMGGLENVSI